MDETKKTAGGSADEQIEDLPVNDERAEQAKGGRWFNPQPEPPG